ncbi:O-antigen ligase family protein [Microbacterium sp. zg.Y625]|uniref:O-antigen ligase family protein n=1 Tax=Microbacterium jiangjiandongii TaxID=3049071 RepID=UPI00214C9458|nr:MULTISPECIES: O-antigen ligase family protein [unclassified Microbacterium]MCR2793523.1 O-antigen ligase family protein [Microbacterium sp. zg.Y625]WIM25877.1 O-antigen ligase family protein [Microbacterium sp. zg-Y625]
MTSPSNSSTQGEGAIKRWRIALVGFAFVLASSPVVFRDHPEWLSFALCGLAVMVLCTAGRGTKVTAGLAIFVTWAALSAIWSSDQVGTAIDLATLAASVVIGFAFAGFGARIVAQGLLVGSATSTGVSLLLGIIAPSYGRSDEFGGALTGIYAHRNLLASVAVICLALIVARMMNASTAKERWGLALLSTVVLATIAATNSSSAIVIAAVVVIGGAFVRFGGLLGPLGRLGLLPLLSVLIGGFGLPMLIQSVPEITASVGRDTTLTGRTAIWNIVLSLTAERPLVGYGWGGVWRGEVGDFVRYAFGWNTARSAHSGFFDVLLQLGWVGALVMAGAALAAAIRSVKLSVASPEFSWLVLVLIALFVNSLSESLLTRPLGTLLLAAIAAVSLVELRRRTIEPPVFGGRGASAGSDMPQLARRP